MSLSVLGVPLSTIGVPLIAFFKCLKCLYVTVNLIFNVPSVCAPPCVQLLGVEGHLAAIRMFRISLQNHSAAASAGIRAAGAAVRTFSTVKEIADQQRKEAAESAAAGGETKPQSDPLGSLSPAQVMTSWPYCH